MSLSLPAMADMRDIQLTVKAHGLKPIEAAAAIVLARAMKMDVGVVVRNARSHRMSVRDSGPAYVISKNRHCSVNDMYDQRRKHNGWDDVARDSGYNCPVYKKVSKYGFDSDTNYWVSGISDAYHLNNDDWRYFDEYGMQRDDILSLLAYTDGDKSEMYEYMDYRYGSQNRGGNSQHCEDSSDYRGGYNDRGSYDRNNRNNHGNAYGKNKSKSKRRDDR